MCPGGTVFCAPGVPPDSWMPCGWGSGAWVEGGALRGPSYLTECHITALVSPFCRPRERGHSCEAACPLTRTHWVLVWVRRPLGPEEPAARTDRLVASAPPSGSRLLPTLPWTLTSPAVGPFLPLILPHPRGSACAPLEGVSGSAPWAGGGGGVLCVLPGGEGVCHSEKNWPCGPWPRRECG